MHVRDIRRNLQNILDGLEWSLDDIRHELQFVRGHDIGNETALAVFVGRLARGLYVRTRCALLGHPWTEDRSSFRPESGTEDLSCACGRTGFHHTSY